MTKRDIFLYGLMVAVICISPVCGSSGNVSLAVDSGYVVAGQSFTFTDNAIACAEIGWSQFNNLVDDGFLATDQYPKDPVGMSNYAYNNHYQDTQTITLSTFLEPTTTWFAPMNFCTGPGIPTNMYAARIYHYYNNSIYVPAGIVNFTGYPLDGYSPLNVGFTILNFTALNSTPTSWSFGDGQTGTTNKSTINHTYQNPGIYTVSMSYYNTSGVHSTITKNNYVLASTSTGMIVNLDVKNAITGALIQDSTVSIMNTTSGVWRNTTAPTGLVYFSTTDPGYLYPLSQNQSITLAANKSGYYPAAATFNIPYTNYLKQLFLMPTSIVNATGTGTVVVTVIRDKDDYFEPGISVVMDSGQIGVTNVAGAVTLFNVTAGDRVVRVTDPDGDYLSTEKSFTLVAGETKLLVMRIVRTGETPVITPVSPVPTVTGTYDPDDPNSPGYGNYTATQVNQAGSEGIVQMLGQLIALWPLIVLGIFMKFMKSAFT